MFIQMIAILIVLAAWGLVWWGVQKLAFPPMVQVVVTVIAGLIGLALIYNWVVGGGMASLTH